MCIYFYWFPAGLSCFWRCCVNVCVLLDEDLEPRGFIIVYRSRSLLFSHSCFNVPVHVSVCLWWLFCGSESLPGSRWGRKGLVSTVGSLRCLLRGDLCLKQQVDVWLSGSSVPCDAGLYEMSQKHRVMTDRCAFDSWSRWAQSRRGALLHFTAVTSERMCNKLFRHF